MKKLILKSLAACAAVCCLGACNPLEKESAINQFDALNAMLNASYSQIVITVTDSFDEHTALNSKYIIQYSEDCITVNYTVEKFSALTLDEPLTDMKTTFIGEAVIKDGVMTIVNGDDIHLTAADIVKTGLTFKEEYFENTQLSGIYLKADVKNPSAFLGSQLSCTDMKVDATFLEVFYDILITYVSDNGNKVEYKYIFTI